MKKCVKDMKKCPGNMKQYEDIIGIGKMKKYLANMKRNVGNMKKYVGNMKKYVGSPPVIGCGTWKSEARCESSCSSHLI